MPRWVFDIVWPSTYIEKGIIPTNGGAPVSTGTKKYEMHTEAHDLVKTWKLINC
jgi:hypothetical protein